MGSSNLMLFVSCVTINTKYAIVIIFLNETQVNILNVKCMELVYFFNTILNHIDHMGWK